MLGRKLYFLNSFYEKQELTKNPEYNGNNKKWLVGRDDFLFYTIKDCETNETEIKIVNKPKFRFYKTKSKDYKYHQVSMPLDQLEEYNCDYNSKDYEIAGLLGLKNQYIDSSRQSYTREDGSYVNMRNLFISKYITNSPYLYGVDFDIEDQYKNDFMEANGRDIWQLYGKMKLSFLDIEVDQYKKEWDATKKTGPINSITYFDSFTNTLYILALFNQPDNPDMVDVKNNPETFLKDYLIPIAHGDYNYKLTFYDTEAKLIIGLWETIHILKPDFVGIWNMNFDIPYILKRMEILGLDKTLSCHPDVPDEYKVVRYIEDSKRNMSMADRIKKGGSDGNTHPSRLWDWCIISGYTQFYDMMALYSHIRKRNILPSYKLDDIAENETGFGKVDYHEKGYTIRKFAYQDFKLFLAYSAVDTLRLRQIENFTEDLFKQIIFADNTQLRRSTKVSMCIKNKMFRFYWDKTPREIIGNNVYYDVYERLSGAIVAKPENIRIKGMGISTSSKGYIFDNSVDFDFRSLYPSIMINLNIGKETIAAKIYDIVSKSKEYNNTDDFNRLLLTKDTSIFELGTKYFGLPTIEDMIKNIEKLAIVQKV
jgi:DNA polymerase elongation subunit (family B)